MNMQCFVRHEDRISAEEQTKTKMNQHKAVFTQDKRLQWFGHLEIMKENACSRRTFKVEPSKLLVVSPKDDLEK